MVPVGLSSDAIREVSSDMSAGFAAPVRHIDENISQLLEETRGRFKSEGGSVNNDGTTGGLVNVVMAQESLDDLTDAIKNVLSMADREWERLQEQERQQQSTGGSKSHEGGRRATASDTTLTDDDQAFIKQAVLDAQNGELSDYAIGNAIEDIRQKFIEKGRSDTEALVLANKNINSIIKAQNDSLDEAKATREAIKLRAKAAEHYGDEIVSKLTDQEVAEKERERKQALVGTPTKLVGSNKGGALGDTVGQLGSGDLFGGAKSLTDVGSTLGGAASTVAEMLPEGSSLGGSLASGGELLSSVSEAIAPAIGIAAGAAALYGKTMDVTQGNQHLAEEYGMSTDAGTTWTLGAQMGLEAKKTGFTTGLSEQDATQLQKALMNGRADYGSTEYTQGYDFAVSAWQNKGVDTSKAAQYYTDLVVKGGKSMNDLNDAMNVLTDTVHNSNYTMQEAEQQLADTTKNLSGYTGGNTYNAEDMSVELGQYMGNTTLGKSMSGIVGQYNWSTDYYANQTQSQIMSQNPNMSETQASALASMQLMSSGYGLSGSALTYSITPLTENGKTFLQYVQDNDFDGLKSALDTLQSERTNSYGMTWAGLTNYLQTTLGFDQQYTTTADTIVDYAKQFYQGLQGIESGTPENSQWQNEVNSGQTFGQQGWTANILSDADDTLDPLTEYLANKNLNDSLKNKSYDASSGADLMAGVSNKDQMLSELYKAGSISEKQIDMLTDTSSKDMTSQIAKLYEDSGTSQDFATWIASSDNADAIKSLTSKYTDSSIAAQNSDKSSKVEIKLGWLDSSGDVLYAINSATRERFARNSGDSK
jgi:hypothetical protein